VADNALVVRKVQLPSFQKTLRAAQYVRMSTERQRYSIENQAAVIAAYAHVHGLKIVRTYRDEAKSGLRIKNRPGLTQLIQDVSTGHADFDHILVYDVSRWGRFQDVDESAHHEFVCKQAGVKVVYCAEQFENDGSMLSSIMKNLKRVVAAEFSRDLSVKIFAAQCRITELGFRHGGSPGYGLRRELIDENRQSRGYLEDGQRKYLQTDRVLLRPGPSDELQVVQHIFRQFVLERESEIGIARQLNKEGVTNHRGRPWTSWMIRYLLANENYIGNSVYNRRSFRLRETVKVNPPKDWIRTKGILQPIVAPNLFSRAQRIIELRRLSLDDDEMLVRLKSLLDRKGRLSKLIIDKALGVSCTTMYQIRFGSLRNAYRRISYRAGRDYSYIDRKGAAKEMLGAFASDVIAAIEKAGGKACFESGADVLTVDNRLPISLRIARCWRAAGESPNWAIRRRVRLPNGQILAIRLDEANDCIVDYFLLPSAMMKAPTFRFSERNRYRLESYHFATRDALLMSIAVGRTTEADKSCGQMT
jgi:DNA invertase Pin-like site-specific DNA recombinase